MLKPQILFIALLCVACLHPTTKTPEKDAEPRANFGVSLSEEQAPNASLTGVNVRLTTLWLASEQDPNSDELTAPKKPFASTKKTDQDGNVDFGALPIGSYLIEVDDPRYLKRSQEVSLSSTYETYISIELARIADLSGVVVDPKGNPIKGASLQFWSIRANEAEATSDADGRFICRCPAGAVNMHVIAAGFAPIDLPVTLTPKANPPSRIELKPSRSLDVRVDFGALTPTGEVPPIVYVKGPDGYQQGLQLWNWSSVLFIDVPPAPVQVIIEHPGSGILVREEIAASSSAANFQLAPNQLVVEIERRGTPPQRPCCYTPRVFVKCPSMPERARAVADNTPSATFYWIPSERCEVRYEQEPPIFVTPSKLEKIKLAVSFSAP